MTDRQKLIVLLVLVGVFLVVNFRGYLAPAASSTPARPNLRGSTGSRIPDADLNLAALDSVAQVDPEQATRNIFQYGQLARPPVQRPKQPEPDQEVKYVPPPPPPAPVRFFGFSRSSAGGAPRVFLTSGEQTFIVREGETFMQRYRLVRVGKGNVEVEETSGSNRWVIPLEQP
jgi:hypothetical protein